METWLEVPLSAWQISTNSRIHVSSSSPRAPVVVACRKRSSKPVSLTPSAPVDPLFIFLPIQKPYHGKRERERERDNMTAAISMVGEGKEEKGPEGEESGGGRPLVHSQVRRIREEDLRIGDGIGEGLSARDLRIPVPLHTAAADALLYSRLALPSSPLRNSKAAFGSA
ncbi:hypothetical protein MUK42_19527 [Musa troglodytarum]|uniref:Uncharacterized protein n=1 Tax=Musa troglodytarum TaxID=320322 RepID=A0A9E7G0E8_9LILI|nr:hypothetical protein MUK42_19527 [Musa troglodytarum]